MKKPVFTLGGLLTGLISAAAIREITCIMNAKIDKSKESWQKTIKNVLSKESITHEDIKTHLCDNLPVSFPEKERKEILRDCNKSVDIFIDKVVEKLDTVIPEEIVELVTRGS